MKNNADVFHVDGDPTGGVKNDIQVTTIISTHRESQTSTGKAKPPIKSQEIMKTVPQQTEKEIHQQTAVSRYSSGEFEDVAETPVNDVEKALPTKNDSTYNEVHDRAHLVPSSGAYQ